MPDVDAAILSRVMPLGAFYRSGQPEGSQNTGEQQGVGGCIMLCVQTNLCGRVHERCGTA